MSYMRTLHLKIKLTQKHSDISKSFKIYCLNFNCIVFQTKDYPIYVMQSISQYLSYNSKKNRAFRGKANFLLYGKYNFILILLSLPSSVSKYFLFQSEIYLYISVFVLHIQQLSFPRYQTPFSYSASLERLT